MSAFIHRVKPVWRDMDALGHVNNAVYATYLENAREAFWREVAGPFDRFPFILARLEIDFRAPATWRDEVVARVTVSRIGTSSFELSYGLEDAAGRRLVDAKTVLVMFDYAAGKAVPIDDATRAKLEQRRESP
jgi:acyl-CoA thioester hydrolase